MKSIKFLFLLCVFVLLPGNGITQLVNSAWPMFQYNPQHTGQSLYCGPETPEVKWVFETDEEGTSCPVIDQDGTIYFCEGTLDSLVDTCGYLIALNPNGTLKWKFQLGGIAGVTAPAIATNGTIYIRRATPQNLFGEGAFFAINPDGTLKWKYAASELFAPDPPSPAIATDGTIYVPLEEIRLYAFTPDGEVKWMFTSPAGSSIISSPAIGHEGTIYVTDCSYFLYAIDNAGSLKWQYDLHPGAHGGAWASPSVGSDGTIYTTDYDDSLCAINPDGSLKWKYPVKFNSKECTPAIGSDGTIYYCGRTELHAIKPDGSIKWTYPFGSNVIVIDAQGTIYVRGRNSVEAIKSNGTRKWKWEDQIFAPLSNKGAILPSFCISPDSTLYITSAQYPWNSNIGKNGIYALSNIQVKVEQEDLAMPNTFWLSQNYPNPFNSNTIINYRLTMSSHVELSIYNILGEKVCTLVNEIQPAGEHTVQFEADDLSDGIYFYKIKVDKFEQLLKMILQK